MNYIDIIGIQLKDDFLLDLFETYDVDVKYIYDRTHENIDDEYKASINEMGLEFLFDKSQKLITLFMKNVNHNGFNPFSDDDPRNTPFKSGEKAIEYAENNSIQYHHQESKEDGFFGKIPEWIKFDFGRYCIHYQFNKTEVEMVTLQVKNA